jgi:hypothetical protein
MSYDISSIYHDVHKDAAQKPRNRTITNAYKKMFKINLRKIMGAYKLIPRGTEERKLKIRTSR